MEHHRFDALTHRLGAATSRREAVRILIASAAAAVVTPVLSACSGEGGNPTEPPVEEPFPELAMPELDPPAAEALRERAEADRDFAAIRRHFEAFGYSETSAAAHRLLRDDEEVVSAYWMTMALTGSDQTARLAFGALAGGEVSAHAIVFGAGAVPIVGFFADPDGLLHPVFPPEGAGASASGLARMTMPPPGTTVFEPSTEEVNRICERDRECCGCVKECITGARDDGDDAGDLMWLLCFPLINRTSPWFAVSCWVASKSVPGAARLSRYRKCYGHRCADLCFGCDGPCADGTRCAPAPDGTVFCAEVCDNFNALGGPVRQTCHPGEVCMSYFEDPTGLRHACIEESQITTPDGHLDPGQLCRNGVPMGNYAVALTPLQRAWRCCPFAGVDCKSRPDGTWRGCCPSRCGFRGTAFGCLLPGGSADLDVPTPVGGGLAPN